MDCFCSKLGRRALLFDLYDHLQEEFIMLLQNDQAIDVLQVRLDGGQLMRSRMKD